MDTTKCFMCGVSLEETDAQYSIPDKSGVHHRFCGACGKPISKAYNKAWAEGDRRNAAFHCRFK